MAFYVDDLKVGGVVELCKALKIPPVSVPFRHRVKEFEMNMERDARGNPKRDRDGNYETKRKIAGVPAFTAYIQGQSEVRVRWAANQRKDKDNLFTYTPTMITLDPGEDGTVYLNNEEEFAFWYLHPWNLQSPFHEKGAPYYFEYKDNDLRSKTENDLEEARVDAISIVVGRNSFSISKLRTIAKGLNFTGVDDMSDEVLRKRLRDYASNDPNGFINKVDSREIVFGGKIQDAIDKGIIVLQNLNGMQRWYINGKELVPVAFGTDPVTVLKDEVSANYHLYAEELDKALSGMNVSAALNNPEMDKYFEEEPVPNVLTSFELTDEQKGFLRKMQEEDWFNVKIKKYAELDPAAITNVQQKKAYNDNLPAIEAYKLSLRLMEIEPV